MDRIKRKFKIEIDGHQATVLAETKTEAIERGIHKIYGTDCFWHEDSGLPGYGQVFRALRPTKNNSNPGSSSVTYQRGITVTPLAPKSTKFIAQEAADRAEVDAEAEARKNRYAVCQKCGETFHDPHNLSTLYGGFCQRCQFEREQGD